MNEYTPESIRSLSGRDLDRAVEELCYVNHPDIRRRGDPEDPRRWTTDANLTMCVFNPGGPLEPTGEKCYPIVKRIEACYVWLHKESADGLLLSMGVFASGSTIMEAVCRAACIVALEKGREE